MAIKINEILHRLKSGARTNKYRVIIPLLGRDFDIQCHEVSSAGRSIGTAEVFLRGRKFLLAGDRSDEGTIQISFYNDPHLSIRNFFLRYIEAIQSYATPVSVDETSALLSNGEISALTLMRDAVANLEGYISELKHNLDSLLSIAGFDFFISGPWYQSEFTIQQLDENEDVVSTTIFHNAWISEVSEIQYTDETGDISKTTLTITYTGSTII